MATTASTTSITASIPFFTASSSGFTYSLFNPTPSSRRLSTAEQVGIVLGIAGFLLSILGVYICLKKHRTRSRPVETSEEDNHLQRDAFRIGISARNHRFASRMADHGREDVSRPATVSDAAVPTEMSHITRPTRTTRPTRRSEVGSEAAVTLSETNFSSQLA